MFTSDSSDPYCGRILAGDYSPALKERIARYIALYSAYEETRSPAILYISAWRENEKEVWYEYVSRQFVGLMGCRPTEMAEAFRNALIERRVYRYVGPELAIQKEVEARERLDTAWKAVRDEGRKTGEIEAVYKLAVTPGGTLWLKDRAVIEPYAGDGVFLSLGCLTVVSKEMEAEDELQRHRDNLESTVLERTSELTRLNGLLMREVLDRKQAESNLQKSFDQLERNLDEMINVMAQTVEVRDPYTAGHQRRATEIAVAVAREIGLPEDQVKGLQMAGRIHDIGKISIPAEILCKPGRLDDAEVQLIRRHPSIGYEILKHVDFPWPVALIVEQHHEKMDGSGYPRGLLGEEILIEARILSVADVVESISSHRPYRPSLGIQKALLEIAEHRSILYDPRVVDACLRLFQDKAFTKRMCAPESPPRPFREPSG